EVAGFDPTKGLCCTVERFRVDLRGFAKSDWNVSAAKVFARDFLEAHPQFKAVKPSEVENTWTTHVDYLRKVYRAQTSEIQEVDVRKQRNRRKERCAQIYYRRLAVAEAHPSLRGAITVIKQLGINGMSSDESDHSASNGLATYRIHIKRWRSQKVTDFLRTCDALHLMVRYQLEWDATPGAWPHLRLPSLRFSLRAAVQKLPINFYDQDWLETLNGFQKDVLQPRSEECDLEIPDSIAR
ncbi:hypothetical protein P692DRAFT_20697506, partial [Suillus brevipes Sb2]